MTGKYLFCIAFLVISMTGARDVSCQDINLTSEVSARKISLNESLTVTVTIWGPDGGKADEPELSPMPAFTVAGTSTSSEYSINNFKASVIKSYMYTLIPQQVGTFDVGAASVRVGRKVISAPATKVEVITGAVQPPQPVPNSQGAPDSQSSRSDENSNIFVNAFVDRKNPYVGEQVTYTFELYNRLRIADSQYEPPSTTGFWQTSLPEIQQVMKTIRGKNYTYHTSKTALFPTTSGELTIGPAALTFSVMGGFFSFGETYRLTTDPITVMVKPLPETGKPDDFTGAVGTFSVSAKTDKTKVKAGEVVTVRVTVTGTGNIDLVTGVQTPDLTAFKTYDPRVMETLSNSGVVVGGAKTWEYVLIPRQKGEPTIAAFRLSYFDPADERYHTVSSEPILVTVLPADAVAFNNPDDTGGKQSIARIATDIRYIKPDRTRLKSSAGALYSSPLFYLLYVVPLAGFVAAVLVKKRQDRIEHDTGLKRKLNAWKHAQKRLTEAERLLAEGDSKGFCGKLHETVTCYIGDMLNIDMGTLTNAEIESIMRTRSIGPDLAERARKTLETCDFFRFASIGTGRITHEKILNDTREIIRQLKDSL